MKYKGIELKEVTEPQIFDPPETMVVWRDDDEEPIIAEVIAIFAESCNFQYRVVINDCSFYSHCAFFPEKTTPRRATNRELARWLAQGKGEYTDPKAEFYNNFSSFSYEECNKDVEVYVNFKVRKWNDTEWHEPDVQYMGIEE
jgi:hypothetical protein